MKSKKPKTIPHPSRASNKKRKRPNTSFTNLALTPQTAARNASLSWPDAPYRKLGQAYCHDLESALPRNPQFKAISLMPETLSAWKASLEPTEPRQTPDALISPLGKWMSHLLGMIEAREAKNKKEQLKKIFDKKNLIKKIFDHETWFRSQQSSLEEVIFFDSLYVPLVRKFWLDTHEYIKNQLLPFRRKQAQSVNSHIKYLEQVCDRLSSKEEGAPFLRSVQAQFQAGIALLKEGVAILSPTLPSASKARRLALQQKFDRLVPLLPTMPQVYVQVTLFHEVVVAAENILRLRGIPAKVIHLTLAEVLPLLFPRTVFPQETYPVPHEAATVQTLYSRYRQK